MHFLERFICRLPPSRCSFFRFFLHPAQKLSFIPPCWQVFLHVPFYYNSQNFFVKLYQRLKCRVQKIIFQNAPLETKKRFSERDFRKALLFFGTFTDFPP